MSSQRSNNYAEINSALRFCELILPQVSRTFAINIRVLEGELYRAVLVAYLFCRLVDTVEDSNALSPETQADLLESYARLFSAPEPDEAELRGWRERWGTLDSENPEHVLVRNCENIFVPFAELQPVYQEAIRDCVVEMAGGMKTTIAEFSPDSKGIRSLGSIADLERYCYYVAGTVGKMLTRLFLHNLPSLAEEQTEVMQKNDLSFALGLQLTNIIKDCATDHQRGWCYIPRDLLGEAGMTPAELLARNKRTQVGEVLNSLIAKTVSHLEDALEYTLAIPASQRSIRLFNLWSLFFAIRTLAHAWDNPDLLDPAKRVKVPRHEIYRTISETQMAVANDDELRQLFATIRGKIPAGCDASY